MKKIFTLLLILSSALSFSQSTTVVISQVYGGGGGSTGTYLNDYVELHNISNSTQLLTGMSLQYGSATGNFGSSTTNIYAFTAGTSIPAGGYLLIQLSAAGSGGVALPVTPDFVTTNLSMSGVSGKVVLANQATALGCGATATVCTLPNASIIDLVSWGVSNNGEGNTTVNNGVALVSTQGCVRKTNGCTETDNNNLDFDVVTAPVPRNSASPAVICGGGPVTSLSISSSLTAFGNVCINTTVGPNSFTITGSNLTTANVTVGALAGFTYSTTSGGSYTSTLSLTQPGGAYSQIIYVKFSPTAVQSYNGNIPVGGGGAASVNAAAAGSGINAPIVTTGAASAVTITTATLAGSITATGCTAVTAYGIEYSTTSGFPNGTGTAVASSNLSGSNFSADLTGLTASTPYYYHAYATNTGGTGYGSQQSFVTNSSTPPVAGLVISQIYGNGGNSGATYTADFVELFNSTSAPITMTGYSIQYGSATTVTTWTGVAPLPTATIPAGGYYLIQMSTGAVGVAIPTPDFVAVPAINMAGAAGRVALVNGTTALVACPASSSYIDLVGFGVTDICFEGSGPAGAPISTTADFRKNNGCTQTHDNANDFEVLPVLPRNSASPLNICGVASPTLTISVPLTAFGGICTGITAGPNSFTITGTTLTSADVTVAALAGFSFSTTAAGTYTSTLTISQPGGSFSQQVFVKFSPVAVQSYSGNIVVAGGGASSVNAAASGAGVNTAPSVTTGASSAVTATTATLAGTISAAGCTAVTAYGIEYSTTIGFPNGTGTQVASSNLAAGNFSSNLISLTPSTTYYYKAYATNGGGTTWGSQQSFVTLAAVPTLTPTALTAFASTCINTTAGPNSFTINGTNLTAANISVGPLAGFTFSTLAGGTYTSTLILTQAGGTYSQTVFVNFTPVAVQSYNNNIPVTGGGASAVSVAASGAGVNTKPSLTTGVASAVTTTTATLAGTITATGCSAVTAYGVEYSITNGFPDGSGTQVASSNLSGGNFSSNLSLLSPNTTYYYKAWATNAGGTGYGNQQSFITQSLTPVLNATALATFGSVCINTTTSQQSFTVNGSALTNANITVGPLPGFTFSTIAGGTYTPTLILSQPGGTFTQDVYVKFTPTAVQSYSGYINVSGGGASSINVAAVGIGVNTAPSVTTGAASAVTAISATAAGSITAIGCTAVTAYGIEYSTTNGFLNGTGTQVASTNLAAGNFSSGLTGLIPSTPYYFKAYATNAGGTTYGTQQTFTTATPAATATGLTTFGNVCLGITAGPNSFTINGTNLTTANVTVGAFPGYTYSTTSGGTYTPSLTLVQTGGTYSQVIFVKFTPVLVQSYSGNIPVTGGGIVATLNVAVVGAGVNTAPSVTTGAASAITQTTATAAGAITATGCTAVTAYGIEYSLTNGFPNNSGTKVASSNLAAGNFSSNLTSLLASTTYYYKAYATNGGGTTWGSQQSFTTLAPVLSATVPAPPFVSTCINTTAGPSSFTITGVGLSTANVTVGPLPGFTFSTIAGGTYTTTLDLSQPGGPYSQQVFVKFTPTAVQSYNGNIPVSGGGAASIIVAAVGSGVNTIATVTTGAASNLTNHSAVLAGGITDNGCSNVTSYGIEYSGINGFGNGMGTKVVSSNLAGGNFSSSLSGLVQGATYYYKGYAVNNGGTAYGPQQTFTLPSIVDGFFLYPVPVQRGTELRVTMNNLVRGNYALLFFNSEGKLVFQKDMNIQGNFINQSFTIPGSLASGSYRVQLVNNDKVLSTITILVF